MHPENTTLCLCPREKILTRLLPWFLAISACEDPAGLRSPPADCNPAAKVDKGKWLARHFGPDLHLSRGRTAQRSGLPNKHCGVVNRATEFSTHCMVPRSHCIAERKLVLDSLSLLWVETTERSVALHTKLPFLPGQSNEWKGLL